MRTNWRDCKAWIDAGLPLSTTSNEACKLYDASVTQASGMYDEPSVGGLEESTKKMLEADPKFVMGHVFANNLCLGGPEKPLHLNTDLKTKMDTLNALVQESQITDRERKHVNALNVQAQGKHYAAVKLWEDILVDYPTDLLASRQAFLAMINLGMPKENKDITTRVLPSYKKDTPGYSIILSWQAFCLEENNFYDLAEKTAKRCLEIERHETYATHALSHVYLMQGQHEKGIEFILSTENDWSRACYLACHNYWHLSLAYAEKGDFSEALGIFDTQIGPRTKKSKSDFNLTDATGLLYRLKLEGVDVGNRWSVLDETCDVYMYAHGRMFTEANLLLSCCHNQDKSKRYKLLESLKQYGKNDPEDWDSKTIVAEVGIPLCEGILAFEDGDYSKAVDLLYPIRYEIIKIGGSDAQRDVFYQLLIHSTLRSPKQEHNRLGRMLLRERRVAKENDSWTDRLLAQFVTSHTT
ncbi:tetratricopeptide repeat protein 38-like [Mytilus californianus]|uniref:tetratricopeptide repeat protein 38-like n=1 Tax=Mytilus californianus TaxID=6549 RepID=UPI00224805F8|nr:tetratricopeptide repeat protein 38-like [Mytilus californianus]